MNIKLCIDPGHGMGNVKPGVMDSGAVGGGVREADVALAWGLTIKAEAAAEGIPFYMTRSDNITPDPVGLRDNRAMQANCTHFLAIHCNAADATSATGVEVFYRDAADKKLAQIALAALVKATGLKPRGDNGGLKKEGESQHSRLAVLEFGPPACLLEIGFVSNPSDRAKLLSREVRLAFADAFLDGLKAGYGVK